MPSCAPGTQSSRRYPRASTTDDFARNIAAVRDRIASSAERSGRRAADIRLLPVSKTLDEGRIRMAIYAGCRELAENKVQEAMRKHRNLEDLDVAWSIIGHLQTNKSRDVAAFASEFQALDSLRIAEALDRRLQAAGRSIDVYVQVNQLLASALGAVVAPTGRKKMELASRGSFSVGADSGAELQR